MSSASLVFGNYDLRAKILNINTVDFLANVKAEHRSKFEVNLPVLRISTWWVRWGCIMCGVGVQEVCTSCAVANAE